MLAEREVTELETARRVREKLQREFGFVWPLLSDPEVIEVVLNPDGRVWVERLSRPFESAGTMSSTQAESLMTTIAACLKTTITRSNPILECELPFNGSRFEGLLSPVVSAPTFAIRRKASRVFTFADYVRAGIMTERQKAIVEAAIDARKNLIVAGGTGCGKTTFANACIHYIAERYPLERLVIMEDTVELQCSSENAVLLRTAEGVDMTRLVRAMMRLRPDRVMAGEVRGPEAFALLKMWNTGHPGGLATLHCDSASEACQRLEECISEATRAPMQRTIARAVGLVIYLAKTPDGRRVQQLLSVDAFDGVNYVTHQED